MERGFYGKTQKYLEAPGLRLCVLSYPPNHYSSLHSHANAYFLLPLQGAMTEECERHTSSFTSSSALFRPAGLSHTAWNQSRHRTLCVELLSESDIWIKDLLSQPQTFHGGSVVSGMRRIYNELQHWDKVSSLVVTGVCMELVAAAWRVGEAPTTTKPRWLPTIERALQDRLADPPSLDELGKVAGVHPGHVARVFKQRIGTSVGDYVRQKRVEESLSLLRRSELSIGDIAAQMGFSDQAHYARQFRKSQGVSPSEYRRHSRM
jgi:AraC family transcriptional regulator